MPSVSAMGVRIDAILRSRSRSRRPWIEATAADLRHGAGGPLETDLHLFIDFEHSTSFANRALDADRRHRQLDHEGPSARRWPARTRSPSHHARDDRATPRGSIDAKIARRRGATMGEAPTNLRERHPDALTASGAAIR